MKKILKVGDKIYAQSLQHTAPSYFNGFPQREQHLIYHLSAICDFSFYRHKLLDSLDTIFTEQKKLRQFLDGKDFDYILIDNPFSMLLLDGQIEIPIVFDCIDWYDEMYLTEFGVDQKYHLLRYGLLLALQKSTKVITQSPVLLDFLKKWGLKTKDTCVLPNGYDQNIFYPYSQKETNKLKKMFANQYKRDLSHSKIIVYTGKLSQWYKNITFIAESLESDNLLFIVGDGPLLNNIPDMANVIKTGPVPLVEVPNYTNIADVVVFPVSVDCSPIAISEYLAVGKPIVMEKGRMEWLLQDGLTGAMVDHTVLSWRQGIQRAIMKKEEISKHNLKLSETLSWQKIATSFTDFIEKT